MEKRKHKAGMDLVRLGRGVVTMLQTETND